MNKKYYLFLDDVRVPNDVIWVNIPPHNYWNIVRSYNEFVNFISKNGVPEYICYDHDLSDMHYGHGLRGDSIPYDQYSERTGYDCAKWLVEYCMKKGVKHPNYVVHSLNPVGAKNIIKYVESYNKTL
jgi:hypothetical protein